MDFEQRYRAMETRDESYAGKFFAAVTSTGIYCRPGLSGRGRRSGRTSAST